MKRPITIMVVMTLAIMSFSPFVIAGDFKSPEIYEDGEFLPTAMIIQRRSGVDTTIFVVERNSTTLLTIDDINVDMSIVDDVSLIEVYNETVATDSHAENSTFYYSIFEISVGVLTIGSYTIYLTAHTPDGIRESSYKMSVVVGSTYEVVRPLSVTFLGYSVSEGEAVDTTVQLNDDANFVYITAGHRTFELLNDAEEWWNGTVFFGDDGENVGIVGVVDNEGIVREYDYSIYISKHAESLELPTVRVVENGDEYVCVVKSAEWFESSAYIEVSTWHVILESDRDVILDLSVAEPKSVDRSFWFYDYTNMEIQAIVGGLSDTAGVIYVLDRSGESVRSIFSGVKVRGVNDWRAMWGLLGDNQLLKDEASMREFGIFNVDYTTVFGVYKADKTLVAIYG